MTTSTYGYSDEYTPSNTTDIVKQTINIARPLAISNDGDAFESDPDVASVVRQNLKNLLLTKRGERIYRRSYGCDLLNLLFQPKTDILKQAIVEEIIKSTNLWMKFVKINGIGVYYCGDQLPVGVREPSETEIIVTISYSFNISADNISDVLTLTVQTYEAQ